MVTEGKQELGTDKQEEVGFSLQDDVRFAIWNGYQRLKFFQKKLLEEKSSLNGFVKTKTARDALNEMYAFVEDSGVEVKNLRYYHNKQLDEFSKLLGFYFLPQQRLINRQVEANEEEIEDSQNGFSIRHWINWKRLCYYFLEVSGITKFERVKSLPSEMGYGAN